MQVLLHPIAGKYLERMNEPEKSRVKTALEKLSREPPEGDIIPVTGQAGFFRVKVGGYRVLFRHRNGHIFVTHINPRGQAYSKKNKGNKR